MRLLLDENLPKRLKEDFSEHEIFTVRDKGWNGIKNGRLLKLMLEESFEVLLTFDKNLRYQQNFTKYPIAVFILTAPNNTYAILSAVVPTIKKHLDEEVFRPGVTIISNTRDRGT